MDNSANFQINIDGNVFAAIQNLFVDFTKIVQVVEVVNKSVTDSTKQITAHVDRTTDSFGGLQDKIDKIKVTAII